MKYLFSLFLLVIALSGCAKYDGWSLKDGDFTFRTRLDSVYTKQSEDYNYCIKEFEVYRKSKLLQTITEFEGSPERCYPFGKQVIIENLFQREDFNFDGYLDFAFLNAVDFTGNATYDCWIYEPSLEKFIRNGALSALPDIEVDKEKKRVYSRTTFSYGGGATSLHLWENGILKTKIDVHEWVNLHQFSDIDSTAHVSTRAIFYPINGELVHLMTYEVDAIAEYPLRTNVYKHYLNLENSLKTLGYKAEIKKKEGRFELEVIQDNKVVPRKGNVYLLDKKPFKFRLKFLKGLKIYAYASLERGMYYDFPKDENIFSNCETKGVSPDTCRFFSPGIITEVPRNKNHELFVSTKNSFDCLMWRKDDKHCSYNSYKAKSMIHAEAEFSVDKIFFFDKNREIKEKSIRELGKDIFITLATKHPYQKDKDVEVQRESFILRFR